MIGAALIYPSCLKIAVNGKRSIGWDKFYIMSRSEDRTRSRGPATYSLKTAILAMGVVLAGVILTSARGVRQGVAQLEARLREGISAVARGNEATGGARGAGGA